jgi:hypothetical protein
MGKVIDFAAVQGARREQRLRWAEADASGDGRDYRQAKAAVRDCVNRLPLGPDVTDWPSAMLQRAVFTRATFDWAVERALMDRGFDAGIREVETWLEKFKSDSGRWPRNRM